MRDRNEAVVMPHLQELLEPTPSGTAKLLAAWDGLTPESQIQLLIAKKKRPGPAYLYSRVIEKALGSENAYVRYLAARECRFSRDDDDHTKTLKERIEGDPDPMVRYAHLETDWVGMTPARGINEFYEPEAFFALPHEARLAKVRRLTGGGETVAKLISYAVEHSLKEGKLSEIELVEILLDYLNKPEFKDRYIKDRLSYDGFGEFLAGKDIEALWELVLKVPESISHVLIEHLPESAGLSSGIPKHVLDGMSDRQLRTMFDRSDIGLQKLRKQKFLEAAEEEGEEKNYAKNFMQGAAITYAFDLTNEEFTEILSKPDKARVRILKNLSMEAQNLRLCLYEAIHDALFVSEVSPMGTDYEYAEWAKRSFERKLKELKGYQRDKELKELRLYRLAVQAIPWKKDEKGYPPSGELAFLEEAVVEGDTWATFAAFSKSWEEAYYRTKRLEKCLPRIWEAGEEENFTLDEDDVDDADQLADRVANKLSDLLATARGEPDEEESKLAQALGKLSGHATVAQEKTLESVNSTKAALAELRHAHDRQRIFTWIVIGLLVTLLFMKW